MRKAPRPPTDIEMIEGGIPMDDVTDPLDRMGPDELIDEASRWLLTALAELDGIRRVLRGERVPLEKNQPLNIVLLSARPTSQPRKRQAKLPSPSPGGGECGWERGPGGEGSPSPGGKVGDGRGGQGVRSTKRPRKQRPPFPRRVE